VPEIQQTPCHVREVAWLQSHLACDRCSQAAPAVWSVHRTAIDIDLDHPVLLLVTVSVHHCDACNHYFRAQPPFLRPDAIYSNRVVEKAVQAVCHDGMAMRRVPARLARDFWVQPSEGMIRHWVRTYYETFDFAADYQPWVVGEFSGILCVDEVYQGQLALLLAVDPATPDGDRLVGYQLVHGHVDATSVEAFLTRLKAAGVEPEQVITDGSALYPTVLSKVWPSAVHQLCLFHETRRVTRAVLEVISSIRRGLPSPPARPSQGRGGPRSPAPPSLDLRDPDTQRWHQRHRERQRRLAEVHELSKQGHSHRAIARQLRLHRQTVKAWLEEQPLSPEDLVSRETLAQAAPSQPARRKALRSALFAEAQALADQGLSYSAIAEQLKMHRVTVSSWLKGSKAVGEPVKIDKIDLGAARDESDAADQPAPPAPWTSWQEVQQVRDELQQHRFLFLRRAEHLSADQQQHLAGLLASPAGSALTVVRSFVEGWHGIWWRASGERCSAEDAQVRFEAWQGKGEYREIAALRRVQGRMAGRRFEKLSQFLRDPRWEATNNGAERMGRAFRHQQAPHFTLRAVDTIEGALVMAACQRRETTLSPIYEPLHICQRGRRPRGKVGQALVA
jgi:transposase